MDALDFARLQVWVQVHGLSLDRFKAHNANNIANSIGRCIRVEDSQIMYQRTYLRLLVDVDMTDPLMPGFKWIDAKGQEKWASVKFERLLDICYGCGRIGHTSKSCSDQVVMNELQDSPLYGPWITGSRPRSTNRWVHIGGTHNQ